MEVKITLTPLGQDEKQNHRTIALSPETLSVSVGRASKNPHKGLLAAPDNAWFDYPILSRTHAKFTASRHLQQIYLQDCGSTHGTYIGRRRLEARAEYAVADGEVITFGQRVTSGAITYLPKEFRVHSKWKSPSEVKDIYFISHNPVHATSTSRPAFTNDFDNSSEPSREGSVQIVESQRHTFSVPSSNDEADTEDEEDEVQIASSVHGDEEEVSAATTPDRQVVEKAYNNTESHPRSSEARLVPSETRGLNLKGPSLQDLLTKTAKDGTSQENPINLEGVCSSIIDVDTESENEGPEVVPFFEPLKIGQSNRSRVWEEPQGVSQTSAVRVPMMTVADKENDRDLEIERHSVVPETRTKEWKRDEGRELERRSVCAESTIGDSDDFDSEDDDGFEYDHEFFADDDLEHYIEPPALNVEKPTSSRAKVTFQVGNIEPHYTMLTPPFDEIRPTRPDHLSMSDAIDVSQPAERSSAWTQRAPSPSDAALARKTSDPKKSLNRDIFDNFPVSCWPAPAKITYSPSTEYAQDNVALREDSTGTLWPELQSPEPRSYDQGPFSTQPKVVIPATRSPKPNNTNDQARKATVTWADPHEDNDDRSARIGKQASKITIPSLVETYITENPGVFMRKYGGMNGSKNVEAAPKAPKASSPATRTSGYKRTFEEANPTIPSYSLEEDPSGTRLQPPTDSSDSTLHCAEDEATQRQGGLRDQDTPLPDAQPRENMFDTSTASTTQDSVSEPALGSVPVTTTTQGQDGEGPARKKAKTSPSSSRGIGKFVMGVGVGLLGAAAAFAATIPASVYEEALREFENAA